MVRRREFLGVAGAGIGEVQVGPVEIGAGIIVIVVEDVHVAAVVGAIGPIGVGHGSVRGDHSVGDPAGLLVVDILISWRYKEDERAELKNPL